jgi:hypothetical protein
LFNGACNIPEIVSYISRDHVRSTRKFMRV